MALGLSNTYILPSAASAISTARSYWNSSLQAILQTFYSPSPPVSTNITNEEGTNVNPPNGMLYYSSTYRQLYVNVENSLKKAGEGPGGNFIPVGAPRLEETLPSANARIGTYQIGELAMVITTNDMGLYYKSSNTATGFTSVKGTSSIIGTSGIADSAITTAKIRDLAVTNAKIATSAVTHNKLHTNVTANNTDVVDNTIDDKFVTPASLNHWFSQQSIAPDDDSITLAKLAHGTNNQVISYNSAGTPINKAVTASMISDLISTLDARYERA